MRTARGFARGQLISANGQLAFVCVLYHAMWKRRESDIHGGCPYTWLPAALSRDQHDAAPAGHMLADVCPQQGGIRLGPNFVMFNYDGMVAAVMALHLDSGRHATLSDTGFRVTEYCKRLLGPNTRS
jgi:hypothetical protein